MANKNVLADQFRAEISNLVGCLDRLNAMTREIKVRKLDFPAADFENTANADLDDKAIDNGVKAIAKIEKMLAEEGVGEALYTLKR